MTDDHCTDHARTLDPDAPLHRRLWFYLVRDRRCRRASLMVAIGVGLGVSAVMVTALQAQGFYLYASILQGRPMPVILEQLFAPLVLGVATGLVTWGVWRTTVSQHGRDLQKHDEELKRLQAEKADKEIMREGFAQLREVVKLSLVNVQAAAQGTADQVKHLRNDMRDALKGRGGDK